MLFLLQVVDPPRSAFPADLPGSGARVDINARVEAYRHGRHDAVAFGRLTAWDCWNKIGAALDATTRVSRGGWLWIVDSDVILVDMRRSLDGVVAFAERQVRACSDRRLAPSEHALCATSCFSRSCVDPPRVAQPHHPAVICCAALCCAVLCYAMLRYVSAQGHHPDALELRRRDQRGLRSIAQLRAP